MRTMTKTLVVLLLVGNASGCEPYHRHDHHIDRGPYDSGYYGGYDYDRGGYGSYLALSEGRYRRHGDERRHQYDDD